MAAKFILLIVDFHLIISNFQENNENICPLYLFRKFCNKERKTIVCLLRTMQHFFERLYSLLDLLFLKYWNGSSFIFVNNDLFILKNSIVVQVFFQKFLNKNLYYVLWINLKNYLYELQKQTNNEKMDKHKKLSSKEYFPGYS